MHDAREALRLVSELRELPPSTTIRAHHLINGLCKLLGARNGLLGILSNFREGSEPEIIHSVIGGDIDSKAQRGFVKYVDTECEKDPLVEATIHNCNKPIVISRSERVCDRDWYNSPHVAEFRKQYTRVDDSIYAYFPMHKPGVVVGLGINRDWSDRPFGEREKNLIELMHDQLAWLYRDFEKENESGNSPGKRPLSPRLQQTLARLVAGDSEKQVANQLGLSIHTIHDYVKALYQRFGVNSRPELLAKCLSNPDAHL